MEISPFNIIPQKQRLFLSPKVRKNHISLTVTTVKRDRGNMENLQQVEVETGA